MTLYGAMQEFPLTTAHILGRMQRIYADSEVVTLREPGETTRASYCRGGGALRAPERGAGRAGRARRRPRGHLLLEHPGAPGGLHGGAHHGRRAAHAEHPPVRGAAGVRGQPRRGQGRAGGRLAGQAAVQGGRPARDRRALRGRGPGRRGRAAEPAGLRGAAGRPEARASTTPSWRRTRPRRSVTPAAPRATRRASCTRTARRCCTPWARAWPSRSAPARPTGSCRSCPCSTPTRGAWRTRPAWWART